jgi:putative spermidine/putrescine transport system ATP-binding protein
LGVTGTYSVRPEKMAISSGPAQSGANSAVGTVIEVIYVGSASRIVIDLQSGKRINVMEQNGSSHITPDRRGERVTVSWKNSDVVQLRS